VKYAQIFKANTDPDVDQDNDSFEIPNLTIENSAADAQ